MDNGEENAVLVEMIVTNLDRLYYDNSVYYVEGSIVLKPGLIVRRIFYSKIAVNNEGLPAWTCISFL